MITSSMESTFADGPSPPAVNALVVLPVVSAYILAIIKSPNLIAFPPDHSVNTSMFLIVVGTAPPNEIARVGELAPLMYNPTTVKSPAS